MATAIQFSVMKTRVALNCGNMQTNDPHYSYVDENVNDSANAIVLMAISKDKRNVNCFPELQNRRWHDVTVNNQGYLDKPSTLLVLDSVSMTKTTTSYDPSRHTEYPVIEEPDQSVFGQFDKASTTTGYPTRWCEASNSILLWPTPTTAFLTRVVLRGIREESTLSSDSDTLTMNARWHPVVIEYATHLTWKQMGEHEEAEKWLVSTEKRMTQVIDLYGLSKRKNRTQIMIAGSL